jgi:hypothetical protein
VAWIGMVGTRARHTRTEFQRKTAGVTLLRAAERSLAAGVWSRAVVSTRLRSSCHAHRGHHGVHKFRDGVVRSRRRS